MNGAEESLAGSKRRRSSAGPRRAAWSSAVWTATVEDGKLVRLRGTKDYSDATRLQRPHAHHPKWLYHEAQLLHR